PNAATSLLSNNVVLYTALFDVDNSSGELRPEMTAQVSFVSGSVKDAIIVPRAAVTGGEDGAELATVTVVDSYGRSPKPEVRVGLRTRFEFEIVSGLTPGELVVVGSKPGTATGGLLRFRL